MPKTNRVAETAKHPAASRASKTLKNITENPQPQEGRIQVVPASALRAEIAKATAKGSIEVKLPPLEFIQTEVEIRGLSPYLVAGWTKKALDMMERPMIEEGYQKPKKTMREKRDPSAEFEAYKVWDEQGRECIPALHVKCAMVNAGIRSTSGVYKADLRGAIFVLGTLLPFTYKKCEMRRDAVRNKNGSPDLRYRPEYHGWRAVVPLRINKALMSLTGAINLLNLAGSMVGLGEWRIEKGGEHGAFEVVV